jgi:hypothetical protein
MNVCNNIHCNESYFLSLGIHDIDIIGFANMQFSHFFISQTGQ